MGFFRSCMFKPFARWKPMDVSTNDGCPRAQAMGGVRSRSPTMLKELGRQAPFSDVLGQRQPQPKRPGLQPGPWFPSFERTRASAPDAPGRIMDPNFARHQRAVRFVVGGVEPPQQGRSQTGIPPIRGIASTTGPCGAGTSLQSADWCGRRPRSPGVRTLDSAPVTPPELLQRWPVAGPHPERAFTPEELLMLPAPYAPVRGRAPTTPEEVRHPALHVAEERAFTPEELRMPPAPCAPVRERAPTTPEEGRHPALQTVPHSEMGARPRRAGSQRRTRRRGDGARSR